MMCKVGSVPVVNSYGVTVHLRIKGIEQDGKREACRGGLLGQFPPQSVFHYGDELVLGDIVLSLEKALEQSREFNHSFEREASYLVVHSVLHLLGYDHMVDEDKVIMRKREEEILNKLNITREI